MEEQKTLGILGCGRLGLAIAKHIKNCYPLSFKIAGTTTNPKKVTKLLDEVDFVEVFKISPDNHNSKWFLDFFIQDLDYLVVSLPPNYYNYKIVVDLLKEKLYPNLKNIFFISTTSVYSILTNIPSSVRTLDEFSTPNLNGFLPPSSKTMAIIEKELLTDIFKDSEVKTKTHIIRLGGLYQKAEEVEKFLQFWDRCYINLTNVDAVGHVVSGVIEESFDYKIINFATTYTVRDVGSHSKIESSYWKINEIITRFKLVGEDLPMKINSRISSLHKTR